MAKFIKIKNKKFPMVNCNSKSDSRIKKFMQQEKARKSAHGITLPVCGSREDASEGH